MPTPNDSTAAAGGAPLPANCWAVGDSALLRWLRVSLALVATLAGAWLMPSGLLVGVLLLAGMAVVVAQWRRQPARLALRLGAGGWVLMEADGSQSPVELAPRQWLFGPLLLLSLRRPGQWLPRQVWISRDAMAPGDYRLLCRALLIGAG